MYPGVPQCVNGGAVRYFKCLSIVILDVCETPHSYQLQAVRVLNLHDAASLLLVPYFR